MPELPDVQVFKQYFDATACHRKIINVDVLEKNMLEDISPKDLKNRLKDRRFISTCRHGKYFFAETDEKDRLILHFGMTGFLKYYKNQDALPEHTRLRIDFDNGYHLAYDCQRKLGKIGMTQDVKKFIRKQQLGIDPYRQNLDFETFWDIFKSTRGSVKSFLMNQKHLAGIGNIYSDEILFRAGIFPGSELEKLNRDDAANIYDSLKKIIRIAVDNKVDLSEMPDDFLLPHREPHAKCPLCGGRIQKEKISGRSSYFCPQHQKRY